MKRLLLALCVLSAFLPSRADAIFWMSRWIPAEKVEFGPLGSEVGREVDGMMAYQSPPSRPYLILGYIQARTGFFGSARTRAVAVAKKHGADAIIELKRSARSPGHFLYKGKYLESSPSIGAYAAIRFPQRKKEKPAWGIANNPCPLPRLSAFLREEVVASEPWSSSADGSAFPGSGGSDREGSPLGGERGRKPSLRSRLGAGLA